MTSSFFERKKQRSVLGKIFNWWYKSETGVKGEEKRGVIVPRDS